MNNLRVIIDKGTTIGYTTLALWQCVHCYLVCANSKNAILNASHAVVVLCIIKPLSYDPLSPSGPGNNCFMISGNGTVGNSFIQGLTFLGVTL